MLRKLHLEDRVCCLSKLTEDGVDVAKPGDLGEVVDVQGAAPTVRFYRTGRATIVDWDEVQRVSCAALALH